MLHRRGRIVLSALLLLPLVAASGGRVVPGGTPSPGGTPFEDATKHVAFVPPSGWLFDPHSNADQLLFAGPKGNGGTPRLTVRTVQAGRPLQEELSAYARRLLAPDTTTPLVAVDTPGAPFLRSAVSFPQKVEGKPTRRLIAAGRNGPEIVFFMFDVADANFDQQRADLLACVSSAQPVPLVPVFADAAMGVAFYYLPKGWDVDESQSTPGKEIGWVRKDEAGNRCGGLSVKVLGDAVSPDAFQKRLVQERLQCTRDPGFTGCKDLDLALSGHVGVLYEVDVSLQGGALRNRRWHIFVQSRSRLFSIYCGAETTNFEEELRPEFEKFIHSIALDLSDAP